MSRKERRTRKEILISQIEEKDNKIDFFQSKIIKLSEDKNELQEQLRELIESEQRAIEEAENNELLQILKRNNVTKEQLIKLIEE